ncbi:hypothetical protein N601_31915 [Rhodococcus erythropolis DN1]|nr:hypothetical protein N601_31915 [Rhodococcus erythropolis DN1]
MSLVCVGEPLFRTAYRIELVGKGFGVQGTKCDGVCTHARCARWLVAEDLYRW